MNVERENKCTRIQANNSRMHKSFPVQTNAEQIEWNEIHLTTDTSQDASKQKKWFPIILLGLSRKLRAKVKLYSVLA